MSEVNYRRNGMKYSTSGNCWGLAPKAGGGLIEAALPGDAAGVRTLPGDATWASRPRDVAAARQRPKSSRERRAMKKGK